MRLTQALHRLSFAPRPPYRCTSLPVRCSAAMAIDHTTAQLERLESRVAELHVQAQQLNKEGRTAEATLVYKELAALDDQALELRLQQPVQADRAAHAAVHPAYCGPALPPPSWEQASASAASLQAVSGALNSASIDRAVLRQRALGAVLGGALGDAAACGMQWVYDLSRLQELADSRPEGLEFFEPPQCPFYDYPPGSSSPYGQQTTVLLRSLVESRGLDCCSYAAAKFEAFGPGFEGYRDRSTKSFLRRYAGGALPPLTGSADDQANCFTRLAPLVALHAGAGLPEMLGAVERMIRVTQDDDTAVAFGCAAAVILHSVILGSSVTAAVGAATAWALQQQQLAAAHSTAASSPEGRSHTPVCTSVSAELWGTVAARLQQVAELAPLPPPQATAQLGRNCHLPQSLTTPLHVLLHLERQQGQQGGQGDSLQDPAPAQTAAQPAGALQRQAQEQQQDGALDAAAAGADFCLPCSFGEGTACELPGRQPTEAEAAASAQQQQAEWPARLPAGGYERAVRLAIREGGCCASRATWAGALAGALMGADQLPPAWAAKMTGWRQTKQLAERLMSLKDEQQAC